MGNKSNKANWGRGLDSQGTANFAGFKVNSLYHYKVHAVYFEQVPNCFGQSTVLTNCCLLSHVNK